MDKQSRKDRLRERFKVLGGLPFPASRERSARTKPLPGRGPGKPLPVHFGASLAHSTPDWVARATPASILTPKPRRVARKSPLWAIEEQWAERPQMPKRRLARGRPCRKDA